MRKLLYITLSLLLLVTSCSLDKTESGTIDTGSAISSVDDAAKMRNYLYLALRGTYSGSCIYLNELNTDIFNASYGYGNRGGTFHRWEYTASDSDVETIWAYHYYTTAVANYLIEEIAKLDQTEMSEDEIATLALYTGECKFMKAVAAYELTQRFCVAYNSSTASTDLGVMLVDTYSPSSDESTYPARSTMAETYAFIDENLSAASTAISSVSGSVGSMFLTKDAVDAMMARVALSKGDYDTAISLSTGLISSGTYPLISTDDEFVALWTNDSGSECIMQLYADYAAGSLPSTNSYYYVGYNASGTYSPDYLLEQWVLDLYSSQDVRYRTWMFENTVTYGTITADVVIFNKFPGNPSLQDATQATSDYINKIKPYRIAEQYLIAAEAYAYKGNDELGSKYLNELRAKRIDGFMEASYTGESLLTEIKTERIKEFIGEGFRFTDIKRYGEGFARSAAQNTDVITTAGSDLSIASSNFRFLWPIPQAEIDSNPQIETQQNPGY